MAVDGCDNYRFVDRVVTGEEESVLSGAQGTPGESISKIPRAAEPRTNLHERTAVLLYGDCKQRTRQVRNGPLDRMLADSLFIEFVALFHRDLNTVAPF